VPFRGVRFAPGRDADTDSNRSTAALDRAARDGADVEPLAWDRAERERVLRKVRAYREIMPPHAFFAGRTAAVIRSLPIAHGEELEVAVYAPARAARRSGIRGIKVAPALATVHEHLGCRLTSPASTWAMLAHELSVRELVRIGDAIVSVPRDSKGIPHPHDCLATVDHLRNAAAAGPRRGAPKLRAAIESIRAGSSSPLETDYRLDAEAAGLPEPELDVDIFDSRGHRIGFTEIVYRAQRVLVEIEGDHHRTNRAQRNRDIEKYAAYVAEGWEVVRLTSLHIRGASPRATSVVRDVLLRRGWQPS